MNKIQRAIEDVQTEITRMQKVKIATEARLDAYLETLESLKSIELDKSIPHVDGVVKVDESLIAKQRWSSWEDVKQQEIYEDHNEGAFVDGFTRGALWMRNTTD